jgi:polyhydroxyalkanoate synthase subunit PhaC
MNKYKSTDALSSENPFEEAARNTIALNPLVGIRGKDLLGGAQVLFKAMINEPKVAADQWLSLLGELTAVVGGSSERRPQAGDKRFADPTWQNSAIHSGLLKAYLAWGDALDGFIEKTSLNGGDKARAHLITTIFIDALAPTNSFASNPAAMRKLIDSGGQSLWHGLKHFIEDLSKNGGCPRRWTRRLSRSARIWRPRPALWCFAMSSSN